MVNKSRSNYKGEHILAAGVRTNTDTWETGINNNVLIIGPSGAGKTRGYVRPNIENGNESLIVSDTKGNLYRALAPSLKRRGYKVVKINFNDLAGGYGYNPLDYIRYDPEKGTYSEQDILSLTSALIPLTSLKDPYWDYAARQYLQVLIPYVLEALPESEHTLEYVSKLAPLMGTPGFRQLINELAMLKPNGTTLMRYNAASVITRAEKMDASIRGILSTNLDPLCFDDALALYSKPEKLDFASLGREKTAVFLTISDIDRSLDKLAVLFVMQAIQTLCREADACPDSCLPVPVRIYLDDFATNATIPDFDNIISVIRSREIYVSIVLQSITQLDTLYGASAAQTIINNCDQMVYLGGQDIATAEYISKKTNKPLHSILCMPLDKAYVFVRGRTPVFGNKYVPEPEPRSKVNEPDRTGRGTGRFAETPEPAPEMATA